MGRTTANEQDDRKGRPYYTRLPLHVREAAVGGVVWYGRPLRCYSDELRITDYDVYQAAWNIDDFLYGVVTDK